MHLQTVRSVVAKKEFDQNNDGEQSTRTLILICILTLHQHDTMITNHKVCAINNNIYGVSQTIIHTRKDVMYKHHINIIPQQIRCISKLISSSKHIIIISNVDNNQWGQLYSYVFINKSQSTTN